jgi:Na+/melibiose symporter-like transporter
MQYLFWEGAFAMAYETWIGPTYLSGVAGELGVGVMWVGLLTSIPAIGAVAQLLGLWHLHQARSIKTYVIRLAGAARGLWAIPVFLAWYWGIRSFSLHETFPATRWFLAAAICSCLSAVVGSASGVAWMSWVREIVPQSFRGRFFGLRQRYTMAAVVAAHAIAVLLIGWKPSGIHLGYGILLVLALIAAALSTGFLARVRDVRRPSVSSTRATQEPMKFAQLLEPLQNERFRSLILFGSVFNGTVQMAGPFFPYYFTRELHLSMSTVSFWTILTNVGWFAASVYWGKCADGKRRLGLPFWTALCLIALSPAFYIFASPRAALWIGPIDYFTNGIFWAGYSLVYTTLLLEACPAERCGLYYSVYAACNGLAGAAGGLLGGQLAIVLIPMGGFRALWALATVLRLGVIALMYPLLIQGNTTESDCAPDAHPVAS